MLFSLVSLKLLFRTNFKKQIQNETNKTKTNKIGKMNTKHSAKFTVEDISYQQAKQNILTTRLTDTRDGENQCMAFI